jgi:hypothetical protein
MGIQWIKVDYKFTRDVFIDGELSGITNIPLAVPGTQRIDLGKPVDYKPSRLTPTVKNTSETNPAKISFVPKV